MADHFTHAPTCDNTPDRIAHLAAQITGFRIMRETEIAPSWWARPIEIGETVSGEVAHRFCTEQNAVTLDRNRLKKHRYYAEPIYATDSDPDMDEALRRARAPRTGVAA
ncbi:hypothetical protein [Streptomyces sp. MBT60]|uniref:hypothetical protein n=1 Tax=Streptomyces sp. MBT60 TaxID=2800409 RepID=UPI00190DC9A4|nr:hypothetical protein [Streptomyces sp. MBT60]MBK3547857.1 hypothetical protein [Streptomyces sp. MBT60]